MSWYEFTCANPKCGKVNRRYRPERGLMRGRPPRYCNPICRQQAWSKKLLYKLVEKVAGFRASGRCLVCGGEVVPGRVKCEWHLEQNREYVRRRRAQFVRAKLCLDCGKSKPIMGLKRCERCMEINRARSRDYRRKNSGG